MRTAVPNEDRERRIQELESLTRAAWAAYSASLRDLSGREYDEAEQASWEALSASLRALGAERDELLTGALQVPH